MSDSKKGVVYIDCCNTLVRADTFPLFLKYCASQSGLYNCARYWIIRILHRLGFLKKTAFVWWLASLDRSNLSGLCEKFTDEVLVGLLNHALVSYLSERYDDYEVVIVSGGLKEYLVPLCRYLGWQGVLAGSIYDHGFCFLVGEKKVEAILDFESKNKLGRTGRVGVGDSELDLPMLNLCETAIWVSDGSFEVIALSAANFEKIIDGAS